MMDCAECRELVEEMGVKLFGCSHCIHKDRIVRFGPRARLLKTTIIGTHSNHTTPNRHIKKLQGKFNSVLDVGCGLGRHLVFPVSVGIDVNVDVLDRAKEKAPCICADGMNLPIRDGVFDLTLFCYSLEYMMDPDRAREEGKRVSSSSFELIHPSKYTWKRVT